MFRHVPGVEVADKTDPVRSGSPDSERDAARAALRRDMGPELFVNPIVLAFAEQVQVEIAKNWREFRGGAFRICLLFGSFFRRRGRALPDGRSRAALCAFSLSTWWLIRG